MAEKEGLRKPHSFKGLACLSGHFGATDNQRFLGGLSTRQQHPASIQSELVAIAHAIERLGCRIGEDPERALLRKAALADRVRALAAQIGGVA